MSKPTQSIFPIENGKLTTVLDCNNLQLINLDESNLSGGGGSGNDTGTTTAILKGDGAHGFADAVAGTDYATVGSVTLKEDQTAHDADIGTLTASIATNTASIATLTTSVAAKADDAATTAALALKADDTDFQVYITSNNSAVAGLVTDVAAITTALGDKADSASVSAALAGKEPTLPTTANDRYILARRNSSGTDAWYFVDPVTLGTTSQSFTDGVENSSTTFTSATANFVAGDVGKTITGDNIPAATTIASRTNSTTIILSAAATATGSGNNFTILNRLEVGGTGTVTSVAVTNNATALISAAVTNPTTSATLTFGIATATGANTFYGNFTAFAGTAGFGSASAARNSLGGTTAGQALFQLANPTAISFPQITALNGAVTRTPAQVLSDIGGESALTFSTPLTRSVGTNIIGIQVATTAQSGYLSNTDWNTFNGKVAGTRTITTTAPLTGGGNLNTDRTLAIPAATASVDGYLSSGDFTTFTNKVPQTRTIAATAPLTVTNLGQLNANLTVAIPKATASVDGYLAASDFGVFLNGTVSSVNAGTGGALVISTSATPPVTRVMLNSVLTSTLQVTLPPSLNYPFSLGFPFIEFVDIAGGTGGSATANFGITLNRSSTDLVDGASSVTLPRGMGYLRVNSNGFNRWTTTKYYVDSFKDGTTPTKTVTLDISQQTAGTPGSLTLANGASVTVHPTDIVPQAGVIVDIGSTGIATKTQLKPTDLLPQEFTIGTTGVGIGAGSVSIVTNSGVIDTIRIAGTLSGTLEIQWPDAVNYNSGETVILVDSSGSVGLTNHATIVSNFGNTFNGNNSFIFDEANGRKVLTSDGATGWAVSLVKTSIQPFQSIISLASFVFVTLDSNAVKQNAHLILGNSQNHLILNGATDGMEFEFMLVQPSSGAAATLTLPNTSYVAGGGAGVISLTATNGAIDRLRGIFDGKANAYFWEAITTNYSSASLPTAPSALTVGTITSTSIALSWTDNASNESGFVVERAAGLSATTGFAALSPAPGANVTTFSDTGVTSGSAYTYRVKAVNSAGSSAYSATANATASAGGPTADLWEVHFNEGGSNLVANATVPVGGTVDLTYADWTAVTQASAFAFNPSAGMVATTGTTITPTGGTPAAITWTYRVVAFKGSLHNVGPLTSTTVGYATINGTAFNRITWTAVTGADFYNIYRTKAGTTPSTVGLIATNVPQATVTLDDTGLPSLGVVPQNIANATDQHSATAHSAITFATNKISVSFWIKGALSTTGTNNILSTSVGVSSFKISYINGNKLQCNIPGGSSGSVNFTVPCTAINNSAWHHVAMTIDASTAIATAADFKVYYDGSSSAQTTTVGTNTKSGALTFPAASPVVGDNPSVFAIDDVRIYGRILTTVETGALFTGNAQ